MLCQNCQKRVANVHFSQILDGQKVEVHLCNHCANENGYINYIEPVDISDFLSSLLEYGSKPYRPKKVEPEKCEVCGMSYEDFQKTGKLGCYNCYTIFQDKLLPLLKNLHGSNHHNGKVPMYLEEEIHISRETKRLKEQLESAIKNEEYERAAEIRDRIRELEVNGGR